MKINEIVNEGVWDNLKTAGQTIKQGAGTIGQGVKQGAGAIGQGVKQGAGAVANYAKQNYQQTMQARQQRFSQAAASQFQPKKLLGKEYSPQQQLRRKNLGTFAGDVARTIGQAQGGVGGGSMMATATSTIPKITIPVGTTLEIQGLGTFNMTAQGWHDADTNQPVKDSNIVNKLNANYFNTVDNSTAGSGNKFSETPPPGAGKSPGPGYIWNGFMWVHK